MANRFNEYFTEIGPTLAKNRERRNGEWAKYMSPINSEFEFTSISYYKVFKAISSIKSKKAAGLDRYRIPAKLLKDVSIVVAPYLQIIFNASLSEGIFPDDWKTAIGSPQFIKLERKMNVKIIGQYQCSLLSQKCLRNLYMSKLITIPPLMISSHHINQVLEKNIRLARHY